MGVWGYVQKGVAIFFEYDTPKIVHIRSKKVGVINRFIQVCIIAYVVGYALVYNKGYQDFDEVTSAATTKVKGTIYTNITDFPPELEHLYNHRIWDVGDYVEPAQENGAFFVMTNVEITPNQTQGACDEDPNMPDVICKSDSDCPVGEPILNGNGVRTGKCIQSTRNESLKVCEIYAWCPVENDELPLKGEALLKDSKEFTVLIKNNIEFPKFGFKKRNVLDTTDKEFLTKCRYNPDNDTAKFCPVFRLGTIVSVAGQDYDTMAIKGGVIQIVINWDCNLDRDWSECVPEYTFRRLDDPNAVLANGYNFRYAHYYEVNGVMTRVLYKATGIRYFILVTGQAGKFNIIPLATNVGAGLALLALATIACDIVVLYLLQKREFYKEKKYLTVKDDDAFLLDEEENR